MSRPASGRKVCTALISPSEPMEIRSSWSTPAWAYFRAMWATRRRLCSMRLAAARLSPANIFSISAASSSFSRGFGNEARADRCSSISQPFSDSHSSISGKNIGRPSLSTESALQWYAVLVETCPGIQ